MRVVALLFGVLVAADVFACSCITGQEPLEAVAAQDAVFRGTVVATEVVFFANGQVFHAKDATEERAGTMHRVAVIKVAERFKGDIGPLVLMATGGGGGDCGYPFATGFSYLIYATWARDKTLMKVAGTERVLTTNICTYTVPTDAHTVNFLAAMRKRYPPTVPTFMK